MKEKHKKFKYLYRIFSKKSSILLFSIIILILIFNCTYLSNIKIKNYEQIGDSDDKEPYESSTYIWTFLDLTNAAEVNNTWFTHYSEIKIKGNLHYFNGTPYNGCVVVVQVNGVQYPNFNDTTDNGDFEINYTINPSLNIYSKHKIEAWVISGFPDPNAEVEYNNQHYIIEVNSTSYFHIQSYNQKIPQYAGGLFNIPNYLNYDNHSGIPYQKVNYTWYNQTKDILGVSNKQFNTKSDGSFIDLIIPNDNISNILYLNLTYNGNGTRIKGNLREITLNLFRNITCQWSTISSSNEGSLVSISGQVLARNNLNFKINYTDFIIRRNGNYVGTVNTNANGFFSFSYQIPTGTQGSNIFTIELESDSDVYSNVTHIMTVSLAPTPISSPGDDTKETAAPFQNFFIIFIPIIIGIIAALLIFGYIRFKKQEEESRVVRLPLEDRIMNLKLLKDSGRMEEAVSYLFQSIYMELVKAKFGKIKKETETIRDFAIISVREFKMNPASIYPFIQNIEKVIYDKPFIIGDDDFYQSIELFSPIYFELTGFQFVLNF